MKPATLVKKGLLHRSFLVNIAKILKPLFYRTPPNYFFLGPLFRRYDFTNKENWKKSTEVAYLKLFSQQPGHL